MESHLITARYASVPLYKTILRGTAWLLAFAYAFGLVYAFFATAGTDLISRIVGVVTGVLIIIAFLAIAELFVVIIDLLLDIEDHARRLLDHTTGERSGSTPLIKPHVAPAKEPPPTPAPTVAAPPDPVAAPIAGAEPETPKSVASTSRSATTKEAPKKTDKPRRPRRSPATASGNE